MTFYEELGLRPDASAGEIRRAYRNLVRLLHPDRQTQEPLRRLAETQIKRLNLVYGTLSDPVRRRQYDLGTVLAVAPRRRARGPTAREICWFMAGLVLATFYWQLSPRPERRTEASVQPAGQAPGPSAALPAPSTRRVRSLPLAAASKPEAGGPDREPSPPAQTAAPRGQPAVNAPALAVTLAAPAMLLPEMPAVPQPPVGRSFQGTWIYVPPPAAASGQASYPAEYVEAVIVEQAGEIRGTYRARYRVPDLPISSQVAFRFEGKAQGGEAGLQWRGAGGSAGELKLVLLSPQTMRLEWFATAMGTQLGLASGSAVLTRRLDP